jgi:hypothetical protein
MVHVSSQLQRTSGANIVQHYTLWAIMDTRRGSNHNNKGKHSRYTEDNDEEEKNKRSRANNSNLAGGNAVRSINMEPEKQTQDVAMHPLDLATNKESSLRSVAEKSALVFEDPLNNSPTHNTSPKMSDDNNNNISEPSNNGNNDNISESLAAMDQGEESDSPAPPAAVTKMVILQHPPIITWQESPQQVLLGYHNRRFHHVTKSTLPSFSMRHSLWINGMTQLMRFITQWWILGTRIILQSEKKEHDP